MQSFCIDASSIAAQSNCSSQIVHIELQMLSKSKRPYEPESLDKHTRLRKNIGDLLASNHASGSRLAEVVNDVNRCAPHLLSELSSKPGTRRDKQTQRMKHKFLKKSHWMPDYVTDVRCWDPATNKIKVEKVSMQLIHEVVAVLLKNGLKEKLLDRSNMDPLSLQHLIHCETSAGVDEMLGLGIWGDGAPTQWNRDETIDVISLSLPGSKDYSGLRIPLVILPHSRTCSETWHDIFAIIKWSLSILAGGRWPTKRHDGTPWNDTDKSRKTPRKLILSVLVESRQDWKFAAEVFGFPTHRSAEGICWRCHCTSQNVTRAQPNSTHTHTLTHTFAGAKAPPRNSGTHVEIEKMDITGLGDHSPWSALEKICFSIFSLGETCFFCSTLEK